MNICRTAGLSRPQPTRDHLDRGAADDLAATVAPVLPALGIAAEQDQLVDTLRDGAPRRRAAIAQPCESPNSENRSRPAASTTASRSSTWRSKPKGRARPSSDRPMPRRRSGRGGCGSPTPRRRAARPGSPSRTRGGAASSPPSGAAARSRRPHRRSGCRRRCGSSGFPAAAGTLARRPGLRRRPRPATRRSGSRGRARPQVALLAAVVVERPPRRADRRSRWRRRR